MKKFYNVVFVGAGLANCLAAYRLLHVRPDIEFLLLDVAETFGGNHTWSFHDTDVSAGNLSWLMPLVSAGWDGSDVRFPSYQRTLPGRYHAVQSAHLHTVLSSLFHYQRGLGHGVKDVFDDSVVLENGKTIHATCVVDGRGWQAPPGADLGYQKFVGLDLTFRSPHGVSRPLIMDATVPQDDGFRFFYALPWTDKTLLLEETHYSDTPDIDEAAYVRHILDYAARQGWDVGSVGRREVGSLAIPLNDAFPPQQPGVVVSGTRAGFFHATTGYSLPEAVRFAEGFAHSANFSGAVMSRAWEKRARGHWRRQRFFRLLNRLMFKAAVPAERYRMLELFYRQHAGLISRFYSGRLGVLDKVRFFIGRPPVKISRALWELIR